MTMKHFVRKSRSRIPHLGGLALAACLIAIQIRAEADLTREQAIRRAQDYIKKAGLPDPNPIPLAPPERRQFFSTYSPPPQAATIRAGIQQSPFGARVWDIQLYGDYHLQID